MMKSIENPTDRRSRLRRSVRAIVLYAGLPYAAIVLFFFSMQRSMLYPAGRATSLPAIQCGLMADSARDVEVVTDDGLTLHGWHVVSSEEAAANLLLIYFAGNGGHRGGRAADCREFARLGCDVLFVDYRGYGDNSGSPCEAGLAADAQAVWRYAVEELRTPPERIILFGESLGGAVAVRLAAEQSVIKRPPAALVTSSTFASLPDVVSALYPCFPFRYLVLDRYPSQDRIADVACPILIFHGTVDTLVSIEQGRCLYAAAPDQSASGIAKRFVEIAGAGHNDLPTTRLADEIAVLIAMLRSTRHGGSDKIQVTGDKQSSISK